MLAYLATYLVPFVQGSWATSSRATWAAVGLLVVIIGAIFVQTDLLDVIPVLYLCGYRVLRARCNKGEVGFVITRSETVPPGTKALRMARGLWVATK